MKIMTLVAVNFLLFFYPVMGHSQPNCVAPELSNIQVKDIVEKNRRDGKGVSAAFPDYTWNVDRVGCHYQYVEVGIPEAPSYRQSYLVNQHGVIVEYYSEEIDCPGEVLVESDLAEIIRQYRKNTQSAQLPYDDYVVRVSRKYCAYYYFEHSLPEVRGGYQVFTVDSLGEVLGHRTSSPY